MIQNQRQVYGTYKGGKKRRTFRCYEEKDTARKKESKIWMHGKARVSVRNRKKQTKRNKIKEPCKFAASRKYKKAVTGPVASLLKARHAVLFQAEELTTMFLSSLN